MSFKNTISLLVVGIGIAASTMAQAQQHSEFVWTKLSGSTSLPPEWCSFPSSIDMSRGIVYSLSDSGQFASYNIRSNRFTLLPVSGGWPGNAEQCIYNPDENTIWFTFSGRGQVFRLPVSGGAVTSVGSSGTSSADYYNTTFWNPVTHKYGAVFGYGWGAVRNWRWEFGTNDRDWVQIEANEPGRQPWTCCAANAAIDFTGQRLFVLGGAGNSTGVQGYVDPGFSPASNVELLEDLWVLNLTSDQWSNLIPLNSSIISYGQIVYYPPLDMLLQINGLPSATNQPVTGLWTFSVGSSKNWTQVVATGDVPVASDEITGNGIMVATSFYDSFNNRIVHFNSKGVYALSLGAFPCSPHAAAATATLANGFVIGATITDGGCGYTNTPGVLILGGGGTGATATALVSNGVVVGITITDAGFGYTSLPTIYIYESQPPLPSVSTVAKTIEVTMHVVPGKPYQLQVLLDLTTWKNVGNPFVALTSTIVQDFDATEVGQYFRIQELSANHHSSK